MSDTALQAELDRRLNLTAEDRAILRSGQLPEKYAKSAGNLGCMTIGVAVLGALAGALFGWNTYPVLPHEHLPEARPFVIGTAIVGFLISWIMFRRRFGAALDGVAARLRQGRVQQATVEGKIETQKIEGTDLLVLATTDGRLFQCPIGLRGAAVEGRMRLFFLDFSGVKADGAEAALPFRLPQYVVAIELVE